MRWRADVLAGIDAAIVPMGLSAENATKLRAGMLAKPEPLIGPRFDEWANLVRAARVCISGSATRWASRCCSS